MCKLIGPKGPFQKKHGQIFPFIAYRDGKPVGRIAAIINRSHNTYHKDKVAFFGFFDFIDDLEVAQALLKAALDRLREKGFTSVRGPYNPSINDEIGLLTEGFNAAPFVMMCYNPSYYIPIYEKLGLKVARTLVAFYINAADEPSDRIKKITDRIRKSSGVKVRSIDMKRLKEELTNIHPLYNVTLDRNWGFVPILLEDLLSAADDLKQIVDPEIVLIAEKEGKTVGYCLTIPNVNELLLKTKNMPEWLRILKFLWLLKTTRPKEARLAVLGVHPDFRNIGLGPLFYYDVLLRGRKRGIIGGELSWVDEDNAEITKGITLMSAKPYKQYRIFEMAI